MSGTRAAAAAAAAALAAAASASASSNDRAPHPAATAGAGGGGLKRLRSEPGGNRATVVLGAQWGDEGKGKVVDLLATEADIVCRCQVGRMQVAAAAMMRLARWVANVSAGSCCPAVFQCVVLKEDLSPPTP